ncbi:MAG: hypothetical protein H8E80_04835 [Desulfobacteraceae bacterium]|uniref:Uncharacterized protein n=1 Tax=Candidatus Desulfaltia bathyphila TaxID=2841697 RepID=A0A8J6N6E1_9BACT|nr:hypothetical protein [Candidatus Desulfaltia bathyphila]
MNVTFDTNVWRIVASPQTFPREQSLSSFNTIIDSIRNDLLLGCLSETVFTLEAIQKADRRRFFSEYYPEIKTSVTEGKDGSIGLSFSIGPDPSALSGNNPYLAKHLQDALLLGSKLMRCPRFSGMVNSDLKHQWFINLDEKTHERANKFGAISREIESRGCGMSDMKQIGKRYAPPNKPWIEGLKIAPDNEDVAIVKAVAEWADGDAIAVHYAHGNDFFCTRDKAKSAGVSSILSENNREWLESSYDIKFVSPEDLANILA